MFNCVFPIVNARDSWKMSWVKTLKGQGHSLITFLKSRHDFVFFVNLPKNGPKVQNTKTGKKQRQNLTFYDFFRGQEWRFNSLHRVWCLSCWEGEMPAERCVRLKRLVCLYLSKIKYIDPQNILRMSICQDIPKNFNLKRIRYCYIVLLKLTNISFWVLTLISEKTEFKGSNSEILANF